MRLILLGLIIGVLSGCASNEHPFIYHHVKPVVIEQSGSNFQYQTIHSLEYNNVKNHDKT